MSLEMSLSGSLPCMMRVAGLTQYDGHILLLLKINSKTDSMASTGLYAFNKEFVLLKFCIKSRLPACHGKKKKRNTKIKNTTIKKKKKANK